MSMANEFQPSGIILREPIICGCIDTGIACFLPSVSQFNQDFYMSHCNKFVKIRVKNFQVKQLKWQNMTKEGWRNHFFKGSWKLLNIYSIVSSTMKTPVDDSRFSIHSKWNHFLLMSLVLVLFSIYYHIINFETVSSIRVYIWCPEGYLKKHIL